MLHQCYHVFFVLFCFGVFFVVVVVFQISFFQKGKNFVTQYVTRCQSFVHIRNMKYLINLWRMALNNKNCRNFLNSFLYWFARYMNKAFIEGKLDSGVYWRNKEEYIVRDYWQCNPMKRFIKHIYNKTSKVYCHSKHQAWLLFPLVNIILLHSKKFFEVFGKKVYVI